MQALTYGSFLSFLFFTIDGFFLSFFLFIFFLSSYNDEMWSLQLSITLSCNDETWRFFCLSRANKQYLSVMPIGGVNLYLHSCHSQGDRSYLLPCQCTCVSIHVLLVWILHHKDNSWLLVILELCLLGSRHLKYEIAVLWRRELCIYYCQKW